MASSSAATASGAARFATLYKWYMERLAAMAYRAIRPQQLRTAAAETTSSAGVQTTRRAELLENSAPSDSCSLASLSEDVLTRNSSPVLRLKQNGFSANLRGRCGAQLRLRRPPVNPQSCCYLYFGTRPKRQALGPRTAQISSQRKNRPSPFQR